MAPRELICRTPATTRALISSPVTRTFDKLLLDGDGPIVVVLTVDVYHIARG